MSDGALGPLLPWDPSQMSYLPILKAGPGQDVIWPLHHQCYIPPKLSAIWYAKTSSKVTYYKAMCYDLGFYFITSTHCLPYHITLDVHVQQLTSIYFLHCTYSCTRSQVNVSSHWCCVTRYLIMNITMVHNNRIQHVTLVTGFWSHTNDFVIVWIHYNKS